MSWQGQKTLCFHLFTKRIQLGSGKLGRLGLAVFPAVDGGIAHTQLPSQIFLAQGELLADPFNL